MHEKLSIRFATEEDADAIVEFNRGLALETEDLELDLNTVSDGVHRLMQNPEYGFYLIADYEYLVIASLMITYEWSDWRNGLFWWIQSLYVVPEYRRQGVFKKLFIALNEKARQTGDVAGIRLYVEKDNRIARKAYGEMGMSELSYRMYEQIFS